MKKKYFFITFLFLLAIILEPINVFAYDNIDSNRAKSLTVNFYTQKNGIDTPIDGAKIGIAKIADISIENNNIHYEINPIYDDLDISFDGMSVSDSVEISKKISKLTNNYNYISETNKDGKCKFNIKDNGIYLIVELEAKRNAINYEIFDPYIILVPFATNENKDWTYDIISEPKTILHVTNEESSTPEELSTPEDLSIPEDLSTPEDIVSTGDSSIKTAIFGFTIAATSLLIIILILINKEGRDNDDKDNK